VISAKGWFAGSDGGKSSLKNPAALERMMLSCEAEAGFAEEQRAGK